MAERSCLFCCSLSAKAELEATGGTFCASRSRSDTSSAPEAAAASAPKAAAEGISTSVRNVPPCFGGDRSPSSADMIRVKTKFGLLNRVKTCLRRCRFSRRSRSSPPGTSAAARGHRGSPCPCSASRPETIFDILYCRKLHTSFQEQLYHFIIVAVSRSFDFTSTFESCRVAVVPPVAPEPKSARSEMCEAAVTAAGAAPKSSKGSAAPGME